MPIRPRLSPKLRALLYALLALAACEGVWIGVGEYLLRSGRVDRWLAHRPQRFQATFAGLSSPLPFLVVADGIDLRGQSERLRWQVTGDSAWGLVDPVALVTRKLRFITLRGSGIAVRGYRIARAAEPEQSAQMPPIPAFPGPAGPPQPHRLPWSWEFPDLHLAEVRELWLEESRLEGRLAAHGGFALRRRREAEIFSSVLDLDTALLSVGGAPGGRLSGKLRFTVTPYAYRGADAAAVLSRLDARLAVEGTLLVSQLGDHFLGGARWIALSGPPAPFTADLRIEQGHLLPGSSARFTPTAQEVALFGVGLVGAGDIALAVTTDAGGDRCDATLRFSSFQAVDRERKILLRGTGLHAELATRDLTLDGAPRDLALALDLGKGELPDLADLGGLLPAHSPLRLSGGHGTVTGSGQASSAPHSAHGKLEVRLAGVDVSYSAAQLRGDLRATVVLRDGDLASRSFRIDGTELAAERFRTRSATGDQEGWWARAALPAATLDLGPSPRVHGSFKIALRDTGPLVALYNERRDLPRWAERVLSVDDANAEGAFDWRAQQLSLPSFSSARGDSTAAGSLHLGGGRADARLLLTWKALAAGIEMRGGERTLHLRDARAWYGGGAGRAAAPPAKR